MARIGAIITPFIAQVLLRTSPHAAVSLYGVVAILAAIACITLSIETKGRDLKDKDDDAADDNETNDNNNNTIQAGTSTKRKTPTIDTNNYESMMR
jgi:hypothetical protein